MPTPCTLSSSNRHEFCHPPLRASAAFLPLANFAFAQGWSSAVCELAHWLSGVPQRDKPPGQWADPTKLDGQRNVDTAAAAIIEAVAAVLMAGDPMMVIAAVRQAAFG